MNSFLSKIYKEKNAQEGSVKIMLHLDELMHKNNFKECNDILANVDLTKIPVRMALAFRTITTNVPDELLPERKNYLFKLRNKLENENINQSTIELLCK